MGYGPEDNNWFSGRDLEDNEALDKYTFSLNFFFSNLKLPRGGVSL
jgi:hypothetical protein